MQQMMFLLTLSSLLVLANCSDTTRTIEKPVVQTEFIERNIPVAQRPAPVNLSSPDFHVVNKDNYEEFINEFRVKYGTETFIAFSVRDYEKMALNVAELKRYIEQQNEIIVYYENSVK